MEPFTPQEEDVDDLFGITNNAIEPQNDTATLLSHGSVVVNDDSNDEMDAPSLSSPPMQPPQPQTPAIETNPPSQSQLPPMEPIQSIPEPMEQKQPPPQRTESKMEYMPSYDDEPEDEILPKLNLPIVDSLQPDELILSIHDTITKISQLDPNKEAKIIMAYKDNLIQQLEKLKNISKAIDSLNDMQKTAESLPKNAKTGYPDIEAINLALREHCFFAEQVNLFGMLLIEVCDIKKLRESYSFEYTESFMIKLCETIEEEFVYQHLLFHYSSNRLVCLVYIENEQELMICGKEIIRILTSHSFEVKDQTLHSNISVGAAIYEKPKNGGKEEDDSDSFDFRTWLKNCELGLHKATNSGLKNQCCISKQDDIINAIMPKMTDSASGGHSKHSKSTFSLLARGARTRSTAGSTYGNLKFAETQTNLSPQQIRASIRLYDKLSRLKIKDIEHDEKKEEQNGTKKRNGYLTRDNYKIVALSLCRRMKEQGANYNFQHPKYNGNTILMLSAEKNYDIIIRYFCVKLYEEINFGLVNNDGNNALMMAICNKDVSDDLVKLIAEKTKDKLNMNIDGKTAKQLAEQYGRNDLIPLLNPVEL